MYSITECSVCGEMARSLVCEFNRLIAIDSMRQSPFARSDYVLCHGCGLVYASLRPGAEEYNFLYANFNEFLSRTSELPQTIFRETGPLTAEMREELDRFYVPWWNLRDAPEDGAHVTKPMLSEFESQLRELALLLENVRLADAKVLIVRTKTGDFGDLLKRVFGAAQVDVMVLFPIHQYAAEKNPGLRALSCVNYETFSVPFDVKYNLIIANHLFTHMLDAQQMFAVLRDHLAKKGFMLFRNDPDDSRMFAKGDNLFEELRPFHFQQFDKSTLTRMLETFGLPIRALETRGNNFSGLAQIENRPKRRSRIGRWKLWQRRRMYAQWRKESIASLPESIGEPVFGTEYAKAKDGGWQKERPVRFLERVVVVLVTVMEALARGWELIDLTL
jgi:hypothetical protein